MILLLTALIPGSHTLKGNIIQKYKVICRAEIETQMQRAKVSTPRGESGGGDGGVMNWEIGIDMYTLICIKWITNKNLLYKKIKKINFKNSKKQVILLINKYICDFQIYIQILLFKRMMLKFLYLKNNLNPELFFSKRKNKDFKSRILSFKSNYDKNNYYCHHYFLL